MSAREGKHQARSFAYHYLRGGRGSIPEMVLKLRVSSGFLVDGVKPLEERPEAFSDSENSGMVLRWHIKETSAAVMGHVCIQWIWLSPRYEEFSVIRRLALLAWYGGQKNGLRRLRQGASWLVRPKGCDGCEIFLAGIPVSIWRSRSGGSVSELRQGEAGAAGVLADNPFYTKRFAYYVGRRCRTATIKDVAKDLHLDWHRRQGVGQAIHAGAACWWRNAEAEGDRH